MAKKKRKPRLPKGEDISRKPGKAVAEFKLPAKVDEIAVHAPDHPERAAFHFERPLPPTVKPEVKVEGKSVWVQFKDWAGIS